MKTANGQSRLWMMARFGTERLVGTVISNTKNSSEDMLMWSVCFRFYYCRQEESKMNRQIDDIKLIK